MCSFVCECFFFFSLSFESSISSISSFDDNDYYPVGICCYRCRLCNYIIHIGYIFCLNANLLEIVLTLGDTFKFGCELISVHTEQTCGMWTRTPPTECGSGCDTAMGTGPTDRKLEHKHIWYSFES